MKEFITIGILRLFEGIIYLSAEQINKRRHKLDVLDKNTGRCEIKGEITLKAGEVCGFAGEPPKAIRAVLESTTPEIEIEEVAEIEVEEVAEIEVEDEGGGIEYEHLSWQKLKELVEDAGGEWTNRADAIEFLSGIR